MTDQRALSAVNGGLITGAADLNVRITSTPPFAFGASANNGGTIILNGGQIYTNGPQAFALDARAGSVINATGTIINTAGTNSHGAFISGATANLYNVTINTAGGVSNGVDFNNGATGTVTNASIVSTGNSSHGIVAQNAGTELSVTGGTIDIRGAIGTGGNAYGAGLAAHSGAILNVTGVAVSTRSTMRGAEARGGQLNLNQVSITTQDDTANGVLSWQGGVATLTDTTVQTLGAQSNGLYALGANSVINATGGSTTTAGLGAQGARAEGGGQIGLANANISTFGPGAHALAAIGGGSIVAMGSSISAGGAGAAGIFATGGTATVPNTVTVSGGSLHSALGDLILADGAAVDLTLRNGVQTSNANGRVLHIVNSSVVSLTADNVTLVGDLISDATSVGTVTLQNNTTLTGAIDPIALAVDFSSTWNVTADSVLSNLSNAGTIQVLPPVGGIFKTITTTNYVGAGGTIGLNTFLGSDGSPSDRLIIDGGSATGTTGLRIANAGGGGALTTGDGILVVDAVNGGTTATGSFSLAGRAAAGAYEYNLFQGGASDAQDWFLRSTYTGPVTPPGTPTPPTAPGAPPPLEAAQAPNYRAEVPVNMAAPAMANRFGLAMLGTYHDRNGEDYAEGRSGGERRSAAWGRVFGEAGAVKRGGGGVFGRFNNFHKAGPNYDADMAGIQADLDLYRTERDDGIRDIAGVYVGAGRITGDVDAVYGGRAGSVSMDGYSLGAYWTRKGGSGWYLDAVAQGTWYDQAKATSIFGERIKPNGWAFTASLEGGYPIALGAGWAIEPQAQFIYQRVSLDGGADSFGWTDYDDTDVLYGRVGARLTKDWSIGGRAVTTWARANLWHGFGADAKTTFTNLAGAFPVTLKTGLGGTWAQLGLGVSGRLTDNVNVFAAADYSFAVGEGDDHSLGGRVGIRMTW